MCNTSPDNFCYICGKLFLKRGGKCFSLSDPLILNGYKQYFGFAATNLDKSWTPNSICGSCRRILYHIAQGEERYFTFGRPVLWREPMTHDTDCYFCLTKPATLRQKTIVYPDVSSVTKPEPHSDSLPKPKLVISISSDREPKAIEKCESEWSGESETEKQHFLSQVELNDMIRDLYLPKAKAEVLASRLQQYGYLASETKVTYYRNRSKKLEEFFASIPNYCYCCDIRGLFAALGQKYVPDEWRLFIDGGKGSLKAVLLHKSNIKPSIPVGYAKNVKENYESMQKILKCIDYDQHGWKICADLKIVAILSGLQGGNTKYPCFLCLWDSRDRKNHYTQRIWPLRDENTPSGYNIINVPLIPRDRIILPPLHIKLGLWTNFAKKLPPNGPAMQHLKKKFKISPAKIESGVLDGTQIRALYEDKAFDSSLTTVELEAWEAFKDVVHNFLGNNRSPDYSKKVDILIEKYKAFGKP